MTETIRIYPNGTEEREALQRLADVLTIASKNGITYHVEETYFDYGQNWKWTTICAYRPDGASWQILNPRNHAEIIAGKETLQAAVDLYNGRYWLDK